MNFLGIRQLNALVVLGWAFFKHILSRPFVGRREPKPWLLKLAAEKLAPAPDNAWGIFADAGRCIACGLCDVLAEPGDTPMSWLLSVARQPKDALLVTGEAERIAKLSLAIDNICPARIRTGNLVALIQGNRDRLNPNL